MALRARRGLIHGALFVLLWWALTGGDSRSWVVGIPVVIAATAAAIALNRGRGGWRLSPVGLAAFVPYFLWRSAAGSIDVAWRAFHPRLPIAPALIRYASRLPEAGPARVFFAGVLNLLPGTLSADIEDGHVIVHLLNGESPAVLGELRSLERRVGALFVVSAEDSADVRGTA